MTDNLVQRLRTELLEWLDKTKWVRQTCQTHELGLHRADILRNRIEALTAENERLRDIADAKIDALTAEVEELREHLSGALETLRDAGVCDDGCSLCNEAFAALDTGITIEAPQEGGWKEAGQPWLWTYDPHLKEKQP